MTTSVNKVPTCIYLALCYKIQKCESYYTIRHHKKHRGVRCLSNRGVSLTSFRCPLALALSTILSAIVLFPFLNAMWSGVSKFSSQTVRSALFFMSLRAMSVRLFSQATIRGVRCRRSSTWGYQSRINKRKNMYFTPSLP